MVPMLSKPRILAVCGLGLAALLITLGLLAPRFAAAQFSVPLDFPATTIVLTDPAATVPAQAAAGTPAETAATPGATGTARPGTAAGASQAPAAASGDAGPADASQPDAAQPVPAPRSTSAEGSVTAPVVRQFAITLGQPATETTASARVGITTFRSDVREDFPSLISAEVWSFRVDRETGEAIGDISIADAPATPATDVRIPGYFAKFPAGAQQRSYPFIDVTVRKAFDAAFVRSETAQLPGGGSRELFIYRQDIPPTPVPATGNATPLEVPGPGGAPARLTHSGWRELAVDPRTGLIVGVEEDVKDAYVTPEGRTVSTALAFHGSTPAQQRAETLEAAEPVGSGLHLAAWRAPLLVAGGILAVICLVVAFRPQRARSVGGDGVGSEPGSDNSDGQGSAPDDAAGSASHGDPGSAVVGRGSGPDTDGPDDGAPDDGGPDNGGPSRGPSTGLGGGPDTGYPSTRTGQ